MRLTCAAAVVLAILCATDGRAAPPDKADLGSASFLATPEHPMGWRGDGNGRFLAADPPIAWGRLSVAIKELSAQAKKPKAGDKGKPIPDGVIREWLTLGPVPIPEGKAAKDDFGTDEARLAPGEGDKLGDLAWKATTTDTFWLHFWPMYNNKVPKDGKGFVAYAHTWIHSAEGKPVFMNVMPSGAIRGWLNGKDIVSKADGGLQGCLRVSLPLAEGWNHLLLRVAPLLATDWSRGVVQWHVNVAFLGTDTGDYESKNILWTTPMPDSGPGVGSPCLVGDKLFMQAEAAALVCVAAGDGKVLWARSSTFADAATPEERKNNPEVFAEVDPLAAKVKEALKAYCDAPDKFAADAKVRGERIKNEQKINKLMEKVDASKYAPQSGSEAGEAAMTPVSDGENVYVVYGSGVVACFDLAGNRKWTTVVGVKSAEHGYCASPCLVDGTLIVKSSACLGAVSLNAKTGAVAMPIPLWKSNRLSMYSTPVLATVGKEKLVVQSFGAVTNVRDGKVLARKPASYNSGSDFISPTVEGKTVCSFVQAQDRWDSGSICFIFQTLPDAMSDPLVMKDAKECTYNIKAFPCWFSYDHCASPLLYQGLAYLLNVNGVLTVIDAAKGEVVYQKLLDLSPYLTHGGVVRGGCSSSPTLGGKRIYIWDNQGSTVVIEPGRQFKQVARNRIERLWFRYGPERNECTISNPVFSGNKLFYRAEVNLYCIAEPGK